MKYLFLLLIFFAIKPASHAGVLVLEGKYQLRNIYVLNGTSSGGVGSCITEITVNDAIAPDEITENAFEIDLSIYGLQLGEEVVVKITYRDDCEPKVLNPGALKPDPTFDIVSIEAENGNIIHWTTVNEQGKLPYIIQHKKWNKWINIGEVIGNGTSGKNEYRFEVIPVSGKNEFRVIQKSYDGSTRKSPVVHINSDRPPVTYTYDRKNQLLNFSGKTSYELYDPYGQIIKRGFGSSIDVSNLKKDTYILSYDNSVADFDKK